MQLKQAIASLSELVQQQAAKSDQQKQDVAQQLVSLSQQVAALERRVECAIDTRQPCSSCGSALRAAGCTGDVLPHQDVSCGLAYISEPQSDVFLQGESALSHRAGPVFESNMNQVSTDSMLLHLREHTLRCLICTECEPIRTALDCLCAVVT